MARLKNFAKGLLLGAGYCAVYLTVWHWSVDQWFLPAGLRAASLLFLPYRLWPYLFLGDAAALLTMRVPMVEADGASALWAYLSSLLLMPLFSLLAWAFRRGLPDFRVEQNWLPLVTLCLALWAVLVNKGLNWLLSGPAAYINLENTLKFWIGFYLGIIMFVLPALLWVRREGARFVSSDLLRDIGIAALLMATLFGGAMSMHGVLRQFLLVLMITPAVWLTLSHGWRGAAAGVVMANFAVAMSLPKTNYPGAYDADTLQVQLLVGFAATALFTLGAKISSAFDQVRRFGFAEQQALQVAQASYMSAERTLRNRVIEYADIHLHINKMRGDIATSLKKRGHYAAAMEMTRTGVIQAQLLDDYIAALYPLDIETHGLYGALSSIAFANACDTEVESCLHGESLQLSIGLQLAAYRCVLNAMDILPGASRHRITARVWKLHGKRGVAIVIAADPVMLDVGKSKKTDEIEWEISSRLKAHDGTWKRRHKFKISFFVSETLERKITSWQ
ncbi:MASE1 domain-containing protein [Xanthomonas theicola]|uniref:Histidine kinase n=1 Tax=Xanthomonas theicola TaxID=56464 RepID=A0A2S6ZB48_9XANT|nr:MASE1 domain-containing protein [Xanthomonas theicola]PPT79820.1 histidine kinase [Xanthomonas theicola]QNH24544.1 histidine kinase [Xanthomonas theicola]